MSLFPKPYEPRDFKSLVYDNHMELRQALKNAGLRGWRLVSVYWDGKNHYAWMTKELT